MRSGGGRSRLLASRGKQPPSLAESVFASAEKRGENPGVKTPSPAHSVHYTEEYLSGAKTQQRPRLGLATRLRRAGLLSCVIVPACMRDDAVRG